MTSQAMPPTEIDTLRERVTELENQLARQEQTVLTLQENEARLQSVLNHLMDAPYQRNLRTDCYDYLSPVIEQLTGWTVEELNQANIETVLSWIHLDDLPHVQQEIERTIRLCREIGRATGTLEYRFRTKAGDYRWLGDYLTVVAGDDGQPLYRLGAVRDITERKRAEEAQQESLAKLEHLFEILPVGISVLNHQRQVVKQNPALQKIVGMSAEGLARGDYRQHQFIRPDGTVMPPEEFASARVIRGEPSALNVETGVIKEDGNVVWTSVSAVTVPFSDWSTVIVTQDITERKHAEGALEWTRNTLTEAQKIAHLGSFEYVAATGTTVWSEEEYRIYGLDPAEPSPAYDVMLEQCLPPDDASLLHEAFTRAIQSLSVYELEHRIVRPDGSIRWVYDRAHPYLDQHGNLLRYIGITLDITERKQAEEALRQSEASYRLISENTADVIWVLDPRTGRFTYVSPSVEKLRGYTPAEVMAQPVTAALTPASLQQVSESLAVNLPAFIAQGSGTMSFINEVDQPRKDGSIVNTEVTTTYLFDEQGDVEIVGVSRDITERKRAEEELHHTLEELRRSNAELEQFAYVASHDLQEPLRAVAGMVQLLQQQYQGQLDEEADEFIELAVEGANRMQTLINDLLAYSRVGRRGKPFEPVSAGECLQKALRNLEVAVSESRARITADELPTVTADSTQLVQLLQNLIGNSLKFCNNQPPQIHISTVKGANNWQISVCDNGIGIEPQYFERIFQVFQRLHLRDEYPGTGIGLALCQKIVERHGGKIWVESQPGQGSTFYFTLPRSQS